MGQTWVRLWSDLGQTLVRLGSDLGRTLVRIRSDLGRTARRGRRTCLSFLFANPLSGQKRSNPAQPKAIQPNPTKNDPTQPNRKRSKPSQAKNDPTQPKPTPSRQNNTPKKDKFPFKLSYAKTTQHLEGGLGKSRAFAASPLRQAHEHKPDQT